MTAQYRFGVSQFTTTPWTFDRDLERLPALGVDSIEICEFKLGLGDCARYLPRIASAGLTVSSVQTTVHALFPDSLAPQPSEPRDRLRHIIESLQRIAEHVPEGTPFVVITGAAPQRDCERAYEQALVALGELADVAARVGMRIAFEPLNPVLFNTDTALWGLDRALELVKQVNHPSLGICCDTWNIFETCCVEDVIRECGRRIVLVQVSDWRRPRSGADRRALGDGTIDTVALVRALRKAQYDGPYVLEIFSSESLPDSLWKGDLEDTIARSREAFALIWSAAEADVS